MNAEADDAAAPAPEPNQAPAQPNPAPPKQSSRGGMVEWLWGSAAMKALQERVPQGTPTKLHCNRQANLSLELARNALEPLQPLEYGPAHGAACEHYRQGIYWAIQARGAASSEASGEAPKARDFDTAWDNADRAWLLRAAGDEARLKEVEQALKGKSFVDLAELSPAEQRDLSGTLRVFAETLVDALDPGQLEVERLWVRRMIRMGIVLAVALVGVIVGLFMYDAHEASRDVAVGKPWSISSRYPEGCNSPEQRCANSPNFFFHTLEEQDPWLIIDLQESTRISGIRVKNRGDCCSDRPVPLVVEVSQDRKNWSEVVRRTTEFGTWKAAFAPVQARYVKLHVPRVTNLHLQEVRVLR
ncbi:MAG: discoidin domain-containing protein [Myxococcota bacterium]